MRLKDGECMIRVFRRHPLPAFIKGLKVATISLPFFFLASLFYSMMSTAGAVMVFGGITVFWSLVITHEMIIYYLDKIIVTSHRVIYINWHNLFAREESEAEFEYIQDIETKERGILSKFGLFNYGLFKVETASPNVSIIFEDANNPDGIKDFIYHLQRKQSKIENESLEKSAFYDRTNKFQESAKGDHVVRKQS